MASMASRPRRRAGNDLLSFDDIKMSNQAEKKKTKTPHHLSGLGAALAATLRVGAASLAAILLETARVAAKEAIVEEGCAGGGEKGMELKEKRRKVE